VVVIIFSVFLTFREIVWLWYKTRDYFGDVQNYIQWCLYVTAIVFVSSVFTHNCGCPEPWQWQVGIAAIFLAWLNFIFLASHFPVITLYVIIFRDIFITYFKLLLFALLLVSSFSIILFMMFYNPTDSARVRAVGYWCAINSEERTI
jgi:hypothetical protein